jgi:glycosyltransferase involved in cell wall biosynthesis
MTIETPRVSIIIITYNNEAFIEKCVQSAIEQTFDSKEVIVIDDGSTDSTRTMLEPYMDDIIYHYQDNSGIPKARNKGLDLAQAEFINPMDGDDFFLYTDKVKDQIDLLEQHPNWGMVQGGFQLVDYDNHVFHYLHPWEQLPIEPTLHDVISRLWFNLQSSLIRREWFDKVGRFDPSYQRAEDVDLIMRLVAQDMVIGLQQKEVVAYRIRQHTRESSASDVRDAKYHLKVWTDLFDSGIFPDDIMQDRQTIMLYKTMWSAYLVARVSEFDALSDYLTRVVAHCPPLHHCGMMGYYWLAFAIYQNHYLKTDFIDRDEIIGFLLESPIFKPVLPVNVDKTAYLNWWMNCWWVYHQLEVIGDDDVILREQLDEMPTQFREMNSQPIKQIIKLAQNAITHTAPLPTSQSVDMIAQFWSDVTVARQSPSEHYLVITLYLTMMTRAIFAKQLAVGWLAFRRAVGIGIHPRVISPWLRFFRATGQYALQKVRR